MNKQKDKIFDIIPCLTQSCKTYSGKYLAENWFNGIDKRRINDYLSKFIEINQVSFDFLNITPHLNGYGEGATLSLNTGKNIGTISLRSPVNGKGMGDLVVKPKFTKNIDDDYFKLLDLLKLDSEVKRIGGQLLESDMFYSPPLYLEASKYIENLALLIRDKWLKFSTIEKLTQRPNGMINWNRYVTNCYSATDALNFPCKYNTLSISHLEFQQLLYVFNLCLLEIHSIKTPISIKFKLVNKIDNIMSYFSKIQMVETNRIKINSFDPPRVKTTKLLANNILTNKYTNGVSWTIDYSIVFERYVQYLFNKASNQLGITSYSNPKIFCKSSNLKWQLKYIEPDIIIRKGSKTASIDAKFKSNLIYNESGALKDDFRKDLHQILSYIAFNNETKIGVIVYPSISNLEYEMPFESHISNIKSQIFVLGIPFSLQKINDSIEFIRDFLASNFSNNEFNYPSDTSNEYE